MAKHDVGAIGFDAEDALFVAADVGPHVAIDGPRHYLPGGFKSGRQLDLVTLGLESCQIRWFIDAQKFQVPGLELVEAVFRD